MTETNETNDKPTETVDNSKAGAETGLSIVEEAKRVRDEIKAENDRREKLLAEEQKLKAENMLAGTAGGRVEPQAPKEESSKDYMNKVMSGGLNERREE